MSKIGLSFLVAGFIGCANQTSSHNESKAAASGATKTGPSYSAELVTEGGAKWTAKVSTWYSGGIEYSSLSVRYLQKKNAYYNYQLCLETNVGMFPSEVDMIFILGEGQNTHSISLPMQMRCQIWHTDTDTRFDYPRGEVYVSSTNTELWNKIFPLTSSGERWYAVQVAINFKTTKAWDSNYGKNYSLVLERD